MIDTEHDFTENSEQYHFLDSDLSSVDRKTTPWVIVGGHRPMYVDSETDEISGNPPISHQLRQHLEPLLQVIIIAGKHTLAVLELIVLCKIITKNS